MSTQPSNLRSKILGIAASAQFRRKDTGFGAAIVLLALCGALAGSMLLAGSPGATPAPSSPMSALETPSSAPTPTPSSTPTPAPTAAHALRWLAAVKAPAQPATTDTPGLTLGPGDAEPCDIRSGDSDRRAGPWSEPDETASPTPTPTPTPSPKAAAVPSMAPGHFAKAAAIPKNAGSDAVVLLSTGKVLFVGSSGAFATAAAELYDPATNTFSPAGDMAPMGVSGPSGWPTAGSLSMAST